MSPPRPRSKSTLSFAMRSSARFRMNIEPPVVNFHFIPVHKAGSRPERSKVVGGFGSTGRHGRHRRGGRIITGETPALLLPEVGPASRRSSDLKTAHYPVGASPVDIILRPHIIPSVAW